MKQLSVALKTSIGRGFSVDSLEQMRRFYLAYKHLIPQTTMSETTSRISATPTEASPAFSQVVSAELLDQIKLSWSHYVVLLCAYRSQARQADPSGPGTDADVRELLRPVCKAGERTSHRRHCALPPQKRRVGRTDSIQGCQHLCVEVPALSAVQSRIKGTGGKGPG